MSTDETSSAPTERWPRIAALLANEGHITVGHIAPMDGVAIAADPQALLATVVRRPDETVDQLLERLDHAIGQALTEGVHTNEIKGGRFVLAARRVRKTSK